MRKIKVSFSKNTNNFPKKIFVIFARARNIKCQSVMWIIFVKKAVDVSIFQLTKSRSSRPDVFLRKSVPKICSKRTGEHPCPSVISIKLLCNFIEIIPRHGCSPVNLLHIFTQRKLFLRTPLGGCFCKRLI